MYPICPFLFQIGQGVFGLHLFIIQRKYFDFERTQNQNVRYVSAILNTKSEKSFPDNSDVYKIGKKYYESSKKEEPKTEYLNQRPYLDIQKVIQQEKDIKRFKKAKKKGLTFGGKKTKNNRKNSKRKTRKV